MILWSSITMQVSDEKCPKQGSSLGESWLEVGRTLLALIGYHLLSDVSKSWTGSPLPVVFCSVHGWVKK